MSQQAVIPSHADIVREGFGQTEAIIQRETSATAVAARAQAMVQARYIMAMQRPRNIEQVRQTLLAECNRPTFAREARYKIPRGKVQDERTGQKVQNYIEGPSIRFAEAALRGMRNISVETNVIYDDAQKSVLHIAVTDLESNLPYEHEVTVPKTVERKFLGKGQRPLSQRTNSYGDPVYLVEATDDEVLQKTNALVSKAIRTLGLRHLPGDILDEAMKRCAAVAQQEDAKDPDAARRAIFDGFFSIGVSAEQLAEYLGHEGKVLNPAELDELRAIFAAIRGGDTTWVQVAEAKLGPQDAGDEKAQKEQQKRSAKVQEVLNKRKKQNREKAEKNAAEAAAKKGEGQPAEKTNGAEKPAQKAETTTTQQQPAEPPDKEPAPAANGEIDRGDDPDKY